ncbi:prenyltransferase/squalene oxidase repeat-containing protein [Mangrovimicrobium sediminis]|uniref:prenyltransferase/squalene oxidase repeat-containing protein n=1 Tax=Mangrovimicrobium sediminis TaxID=2562682 RepID=UPI0014369CC8|nr:prenyltransferase/squalene oxidase repeat-containing protein [Haliea sp. SAOS-164]
MSAGELRQAAQDAANWLLVEAGRGWPTTEHRMRFPRRFGFGGDGEEHASDVLARAVIALEILHAADAPAGRNIPALQRLRSNVVPAEAKHVARARLADRGGGWSYFPTLPELPPDLDSLAAALCLFSLAAPNYLPLTYAPARLALDSASAEGAIGTWLLAPDDARSALKRMRYGISKHFGRGVDVEVVARFYLGLQLADPGHYADAITRGADFVARQQRPDGAFTATWYFGDICGTLLCLQLLCTLDAHRQPRSRALAFLTAAVREDGGFGLWQSTPLETAAAIQALVLLQLADKSIVERAVRRLLDFQAQHGGFNPSPWIRMDIGRPARRVEKSLIHQSAAVSTAFCLRALVEAQHFLEPASRP